MFRSRANKWCKPTLGRCGSLLWLMGFARYPIIESFKLLNTYEKTEDKEKR